MERRWFDSTNRLVGVIGQGTWYDESDDRSLAIAALRRGLELGMNHIDTAEMYLSGGAEEWVGEAVAGRREDKAFPFGPPPSELPTRRDGCKQGSLITPCCSAH